MFGDQLHLQSCSALNACKNKLPKAQLEITLEKKQVAYCQRQASKSAAQEKPILHID